MFMVASGSALATVILIVYLMMNEIIEINRSREEIKRIFSPVIVALFIVFISTVIQKVIQMLS